METHSSECCEFLLEGLEFLVATLKIKKRQKKGICIRHLAIRSILIFRSRVLYWRDMAKDLSVLGKLSRVVILRSSNFQRFVNPCLDDTISTNLNIFFKGLIWLFYILEVQSLEDVFWTICLFNNLFEKGFNNFYSWAWEQILWVHGIQIYLINNIWFILKGELTDCLNFVTFQEM